MGRVHWFIAAGVVLIVALQSREAEAQISDQSPPRIPPVILQSAQESKQEPKRTRTSLTPGPGRVPTIDFKSVFASVEKGLVSGTPELFDQHFDKRVFMNLPGERSGYYSADQAYYLLDEFLRARSLEGFRFTTIDVSESTPYATGGTLLSVEGREGRAQVYVSLSYTADRWVISKINIY